MEKDKINIIKEIFGERKSKKLEKTKKPEKSTDQDMSVTFIINGRPMSVDIKYIDEFMEINKNKITNLDFFNVEYRKEYEKII